MIIVMVIMIIMIIIKQTVVRLLGQQDEQVPTRSLASALARQFKTRQLTARQTVIYVYIYIYIYICIYVYICVYMCMCVYI